MRATEPKFVIVIGNHNYFDGIRDHVEYLVGSLIDHFDLVIADKPIAGLVNIVIEEFCDDEFCEKIIRVKTSNSNTKIILVATEYPVMQEGSLTLNHFNKNAGVHTLTEKLLTLAISLNRSIFRAFRTTMLSLRQLGAKIFGSRFVRHWASKLPEFVKRPLIILINYSYDQILRFRSALISILTLITPRPMREQLYREYMKKRGAGLQKMMQYIDLCVSCHPTISREMNDLGWRCITLLPICEVGKWTPVKSSGQNIKIFSTGAGFGYRSKRVKMINSLCSAKKWPIDIQEVGFIDNEFWRGRSNVSLNIPQSPIWKLSSPIRVLRTVKLGIIPINDKVFGDHPIEKCSLTLETFVDVAACNGVEACFEKVRRNANQYNREAKVSGTFFRKNMVCLYSKNVDQNFGSFNSLPVASINHGRVYKNQYYKDILEFCDEKNLSFVIN